MPQPRVTRSQQGNGASGTPSPEEIAKIRASAAGKEQAPSTRGQASFVNWREAADTLGQPFEVEKIPISKLRAMRRDPMLGFGLSFIKTPLVRARWSVDAKDTNGPNAQIAAHLDHDLRKIYGSLVLQWCNSLDFGFQAIAKRFELAKPAGTFVEVNPETGDQEERPIWAEGSVDPISWKTFVALPPEFVEPNWTSQGEFDGIHFAPSSGNAPGGIGASASASTEKDKKEYDIDLYHSLWVTHQRDENFGSIFGYPRLGYSYRYWWSYWFRWAIADRAFERKADPSVVVRHPEGEFIDENTGETLSYSEYALMIGERIRSGGVIAMPSEPYEDMNGRGTINKWDIDFTKDAVDFEPFDRSFDYLDIQKLRSLFIPEQALVEGGGGTSSRNVAAEMGDAFVESQAILAQQIVESINRWLIPQWLAANYPEFLASGGHARIVMQGFADEDVQFTKEVIQLLTQQESGQRELMKLVDLKKILADRGTPLVGFAEQQRREAELAEEAAQAGPLPAEPIPGESVGVVPTATGFSYIQPREVIHLADNKTDDFLASLPDTPHYQDNAIRGFTRQMYTLFNDLYKDEYETAIAALEDIELADDVEFSGNSDKAAKLLSKWKGSGKWSNVLASSGRIMNNVARRAMKLELKRSRLSENFAKSDIEDWIEERVLELGTKVAETTRSEIQNFIAKELEAETPVEEIAEKAREHFADFPEWKARRVARTEVKNIYNQATLLAAKESGVSQVQALDAQFGETDDECHERDGKIFSLEEAQKEIDHPNGSLSWKMLPVELSVIEDDEAEGAYYDEETNTVAFSSDVDSKARARILKTVVDTVIEVVDNANAVQ